MQKTMTEWWKMGCRPVMPHAAGRPRHARPEGWLLSELPGTVLAVN